MASLSGWTEAGVGVILLLLCMGIIVSYMNIDYGQDNDPTFGMSTEDTLQDFKDYQGTLQTGLEGEATTEGTEGISLSSSWGIVKAGISMTFDFVTGGWINNAIGLMNLGKAGDYLALGLRLLFVFSIGFILIKLLFKVKP